MPTVRRHKRSRTVRHKYDYDRMTRNLVIFIIWLAVLLIPITYYGALYFHGLTSEAAIDMAQVAKQEALGRGFVSGYARPALMDLTKRIIFPPDIVNPPLYIWILSLFPGVREGNGGSVSFCSSIFFILGGVLIFQFARMHSGFTKAIVISILYLLNIRMLDVAISGLPYTLTAFLFMLTCFLVYLDSGKSFLLSFLIGMVTGALYLSDYHFLLVVFPVAISVLYGHGQGRWRFFTLFLIGFAAVALPWILRNYRMDLNPFFGFPLKYRAIMGAPLLPDELTYGRFGLSKFKELYSFAAVYGKLVSNLMAIYVRFMQLGGILIMMAFVGSIFMPANGLGAVRAIVCSSIVLVGLSVATDNGGIQGLIPLLPMIILMAVIGLYKLVDKSNALSDNSKAWVIRGFIALSVLPFIGAVASAPSPRARSKGVERSRLVIEELGSIVGGEEIVITNVPWKLAWYSGVPSILLPEGAEDYKRLVSDAGDFKFVYLAGGVKRNMKGVWLSIFSSRSAPSWFLLREGHVLSDKSLLLSNKKRW